MPEPTTVLTFVGDVFLHRADPASALDHVRTALRSADYRFANLESIFTDDPHLAPSALMPVHSPSSNADGFSDRTFTVVSLAHNHSLDAGHRALLDTRARLLADDVSPCGAGADFTEAHQPSVVQAAGRTVSTLAYASMMPMGYEARQNWPGIAAVRARNVHEDTPNHWVPGEVPRTRTEPLPGDVAALTADIEAARASSDLVVASFHWGDWTRKFHVTDHERRTARTAIDAGADIVVGHHHHALRGFEWYRGKPIFYGLGHFVFDSPGLADRAVHLGLWPGHEDDYGAIMRRSGQPENLVFHPDMRLTLIAWCAVDETGVRAGFVPCRLDDAGDPVPLTPESDLGRQVLDYVDAANRAIDSPVRLDDHGTARLGPHQVVELVPATQPPQGTPAP